VAIRDTYDGRHYTIPPGRSHIQFGAAEHFRNRSVIPGSRNPETSKQDRYIVLPRLRDSEDKCFAIDGAAFSEQAARPEAIDRRTLTSAAARNVVVRQTDAEMARLGGAGIGLGSMRPNVGLEGNHEGSTVPADMLTPDDTAVREQAADVAAAAADGYTVDPAPAAASRTQPRRR
jgi:hypothetical protein